MENPIKLDDLGVPLFSETPKVEGVEVEGERTRFSKLLPSQELHIRFSLISTLGFSVGEKTKDIFVAKHMKIATYMINSDACRKIEHCPNLFFSFEIHKLK